MDELTKDVLGTYTTRWECDVPPEGAQFRVLDQEWKNDYNLRIIRKIELISG